MRKIKYLNVSELATTTALSTVENKISDVTNLTTKTALTTLENKILDVSSFVKKTDYNTKVAEIDTKVSSLEVKIAKNKNLLEKVGAGVFLYISENILFDGGDGSPSYLIFQPVHKCIKNFANTRNISEWKSKGLSDESIKPFPTSDNSLTPSIDYYSYKIRVKFNGSILRQPKVSYTHGNIVNIYIVYKLTGSSSHSDDPTLKIFLFGAVTLTKNADIDKYGYSGYGIGFDRRSSFSFPVAGFGQNVLIFGVDMSSSAHIDNKKKDILVLENGVKRKEILLKLTLQWSK